MRYLPINPLAILSLAALLVSTTLHAQQVYKCVKDGKTTFQGRPCDGGIVSKSLSDTSRNRLPWEGLRLGMTMGEVKRIVPDLAEDAGRQSNGRLGQRIQTLRKSGVVVANLPFEAAYYFDEDGHLVNVNAQKGGGLRSGVLNLGDNDGNLADFERLLTDLRLKYGAEVTRTVQSRETGFPGLSAKAEWRAHGGRIFISVSPVTATTSTLHIGLTWQ